MQEYKGWENVEAGSEFERLPNGAYICTILNAEDVADKQYLKIEFDITGGCDKKYLEFSKKAYENVDFWMLSMIRSYKDTAISMFKGFTQAVEKSNDGYKWNWDESTLEGQDIGCVIVTEHYLKNTGDEGQRYKVKSVFDINELEKYQNKTYEDVYAKDLQEAKKEAEKKPAEDPFK